MITHSKLGLMGRLGAQMHQYAAVLGIGRKLGYDIAIPPPEQHLLASCFEITAPILTESDRQQLRHVFQEPLAGYSERIWEIEDFTDLRGNFLSPLYFPPREVLTSEFTFRKDLAEAAAGVLQPLRDEGRPIVGMAVRLYFVNPEVYLPLWHTDYYDRALVEFADLDPIVVVSSNRPDWCRDRFIGDHFVFADSISDAAQLALLTQCDHLIVANSTFAWWGAWLNEGPGRRIVPSQWYGEPVESQRGELPAGWEELEVRIPG